MASSKSAAFSPELHPLHRREALVRAAAEAVAPVVQVVRVAPERAEDQEAQADPVGRRRLPRLLRSPTPR